MPIETKEKAISSKVPTKPVARRFTRDEYYRMKEAGILENGAVELIGGEVILKSPPFDKPFPKCWTHDEYSRMGDLGFFDGQRVQLIGGEIFVMSPQNFRHSSGSDRVVRIIERTFSRGYWVRSQRPLVLGLDSDPEPDVYVAKGAIEDYVDHPKSAVLVIEISDTTLRFDRKRKASLYAAGGIPDYWLINLRDDCLVVHRSPVRNPDEPYGFAFSRTTTLKSGEHISPLEKPHASIAVAKLLPPRFNKRNA